MDSQQKHFKCCLCVVHYGIEGTVSLSVVEDKFKVKTDFLSL